jgi:hypothetical protein
MRKLEVDRVPSDVIARIALCCAVSILDCTASELVGHG